MPRRRRSVNPVTPQEHNEQAFATISQRLMNEIQTGSSMIQLDNKKTAIMPQNGEIIFNWPTKEICVFFDGKWYCMGGIIWKKFRQVSSSAAVVSSTPCYYGGHYIDNDNLTLFRFVHLYDKVGLPTAGDTPAMTIGIPQDSGANQEYSGGVFFENGLSMAFSSSRTGGITGVAVGEMVATLLYNDEDVQV
jgi:hypothetical protein